MRSILLRGVTEESLEVEDEDEEGEDEDPELEAESLSVLVSGLGWLDVEDIWKNFLFFFFFFFHFVDDENGNWVP